MASAMASRTFVAAPASSFAGRRVSAPRAVSIRAPKSALQTTSRAAGWAPGSDAPSHLDGSLPGDYGFDPMGLGKEPALLAWYAQAELQHARWSMLAMAHIMGTGIATEIGIGWDGAGVEWTEAGAFEYYTSAASLFAIQMLLMGWAETRRYMDLREPGSANEDPFGKGSLPEGNVGYPGGFFDPFGYSKGDLSTLKLKEIKNGRLAMIAFLGTAGGSAITGETPFEMLKEHLEDPWANTIITKCSDLFIWNFAADTPSSVIAPVLNSGIGYGLPN